MRHLLQNPFWLKNLRRQVQTFWRHSALASAHGVPPGVHGCPTSVPDTTGDTRHTVRTGNIISTTSASVATSTYGCRITFSHPSPLGHLLAFIFSHTSPTDIQETAKWLTPTRYNESTKTTTFEERSGRHPDPNPINMEMRYSNPGSLLVDVRCVAKVCFLWVLSNL